MMSFLALRRGINYFLLPVSLKAGTFSAIFCQSCLMSCVLALMKFLMVSLAFLSLNFTSSTFYISGFFCAGGLISSSFFSCPKQNSPPILIIAIIIVGNLSKMQGYLQLWQGYISRWSKYYFRIHEELLIYGPSPQEIEGRVHLKVTQIITKLDDPVSLIINTGTETLYLKAYSIDEKVKWYKKLKDTQKMVQELSQNKELFKMKMELSKINRFKILDDLNTELWKCHAELEQRLQEVILKTKNVMVSKNIDRLRISIDEFKYKTSQILQYIDQEIRELKLKEEDKEGSRSKVRPSEITNHKKNHFQELIERQEDTRYYSFYEINQEEKLSPPRLERIQEEQRSSVSSLSLNLKKNKSSKQQFSISSLRKDDKYLFQEEKNPIKFRLFQSNKVYNQLGNIFEKTETRRTLPQRHVLEDNFPIFKTISGALTTDLAKVSLPITLNQPLSMLQKACEQMYYCRLLKRADQSNDENMRMLHVAAFVVSAYSVNQHRTNKPFNPLLGETFEYIDESRGFEFLSQQVSHQPPVSAFYVKSNNYEIFDNLKSTSHFAGNSLKMKSESKTIIKLEKQQDFYVFNKCTLALSNLIAGKLAVEVYGQITIKCKEFNTAITLSFAEDSIWNKYSYEVKGYLENNGKKVYSIHGEWNKDLICQNLQSKQKLLLWSKTHPIFYQYYNYNDLSMQLNNLSLYHCKNLPPTDSRFRPDQRALEHRWVELAAQEKYRLQEKQRGRARQNEKNSTPHKMAWFKAAIIQGEDAYTSNEKYWGEKIKGHWKNSLDLF